MRKVAFALVALVLMACGFEAWWRGSQATLLSHGFAFLKCAEPCGISGDLSPATPR
ncbi:hypothetical protein [Dactylosporangium sp. NPDC050588]|uniref:hypothetical protein n=1 Tax=Dactylosporangium sp. NPDC050588 TaxID=3157211 RepID=UPI0033E0A780